jgi:hypothetical protein
LGFALLNDNTVVNDLLKAGDAGNGFLINHGFTMVWSCWQGDIAPSAGRLTFAPPVVPQVTGLARKEFVFDHLDNPALAPLSNPAADLDPAHARLTVREQETDLRTAPTDLPVSFDTPNGIAIRRPAGFDAGAIYVFIYLAKEPKVMGLGFAATLGDQGRAYWSHRWPPVVLLLPTVQKSSRPTAKSNSTSSGRRWWPLTQKVRPLQCQAMLDFSFLPICRITRLLAINLYLPGHAPIQRIR